MKKVLLLSLISLCACTEPQDILPDGQTFEQTSSKLDVTKTLSVSKTTALSVANNFFNKEMSRNTSLTAEEVFSLNDSIGSPLMYVINYSQGGFVIVSSKKTYYPIIAYSEKNNFPKGDIPEGLEGLENWMQNIKKDISDSYISENDYQSHIQYLWNLYYDDNNKSSVSQSRSAEESQAYANRISELRTSHPGYRFYSLSQCSSNVFSYNGEQILTNFKNLASQYHSPEEYTIVAVKDNTKKNIVGPLLETEWHQNYPFNIKCPNQSLAGCVAIAMAQIMRFHEHPKTYNWNNMPNKTATSDTQQLIYDIGLAVDMNYNPDGSSSNINKAKDAFINRFQYSAVIKDFNPEETLNEIMIHNRPIYMRGEDKNSKTGHAWVCDGSDKSDYETLYFIEYLQGGSYSSPGYPSSDIPGICGYGTYYFHMNWGWLNGSYNGWYKYDNANPGKYNFKGKRKNMYVNPK